jgi:hypothetical protein
MRPCAYVSNTDPSYKSGLHWVGFFFDSRGPAEYMDSYGFPPNEQFERCLGHVYKYNKTFLQYPFSSTCGQYVLYYIFQRCQNIPMDTILNRFSLSDQLSNDIMVNEFVEHHFNVDDLEIFDINFINKQISVAFRQMDLEEAM